MNKVEPERKPVETMEELGTLDQRDVMFGYMAGLNGRDEPGVEFNRPYWHGWRNGMVDGRHWINPDGPQMKLAEAYVGHKKTETKNEVSGAD